MSALENIEGNLRDAYIQLQPGTMLHSDQLTTERRTDLTLRELSFYTADCNIYHLFKDVKDEVLWGIVREPQNLILQNLDDAFDQFKISGNYFSQYQEAYDVFWHDDTVVVEIEALELAKYNDKCGHFGINPKDTKKLNLARRITAQRIFGPDKDNFAENMEMFAKEGINPEIFVLMPDYVKRALHDAGKSYLARASWLGSFDYGSRFIAGGRDIDVNYRVRGVRRSASVSEHEAPQGAAPEIKLLSAPANIEYSEPNRPLTHFDHAELEYAKRLLAGTAGGTVMDWKCVK